MRWSARTETPPACAAKTISALRDLSGRGAVRCLALALGAVAGCIVGGPPAYPLYKNPEYPRAHDEVAVLGGPLASVDGVNVRDKGGVFALSPGCHSYTFLTAEGRYLGRRGGNPVLLPGGLYATRFEAGHVYILDVGPSNSVGPYRYRMRAVDRDPRGNVVIARACSPREVGRS
jgi:hypothetical protein